MISHSPETTDNTHPQTTRRRTLTALASTTTAIITTAGCVSRGDGHSTNDGSANGNTDSIPDIFQSVTVGAYELTVEVENPEEVDSVTLRRPTTGVLDRQQADATLTFALMEEMDLYDPGEFVVEAKAGSEVLGEHTFEMTPNVRVTNIELLEDSSLEVLTSSRSEDESETCTDEPKRLIITVENSGTGPAAVHDIKAELPEEVMEGNREAWRSPNWFDCHSDLTGDWTSIPVLAPGQRLTFAPVRNRIGYRGQEPSDEYTFLLSVLEKASEEWFSQQIHLTFKDIGGGNRVAVMNVIEPTEN